MAQYLHDGVQLGAAFGELGSDGVPEPVGGDGAPNARPFFLPPGTTSPTSMQACWIGVLNT